MSKTKSLKVERIELVQTIQSPENDVVLISDKDIYVRIYLAASVNEMLSGSVTGRLEYSIGQSEPRSSDSLSSLNVNSSVPSVKDRQQLQWNNSLNFLIPKSQLPEESVLQIHSLEVFENDGTKSDSYLANLSEVEKNHSIQKAPDLKVRVLAIRYRDHDQDEFLEPSDVEIDVVRRRLNALYPIKELSFENGNWSSIRVSANEPFRALDPSIKWSYDNEVVATKVMSELFKQIMCHRTMEMQYSDIDSRTIYLGLISDPSGIYGGAAMDSPEYAASHVAAISSTDVDGSLAAHELAHVFGLHHPGVPDRVVYGDAVGQQRIEPPNQGLYPFGFISLHQDANKVHYGLDQSLSRTAPTVLPNTEYFDLMTYRYPQWISKYSYERLLKRLIDIDASSFRSKFSASSWTVICEYNIDEKEGEITHAVKGDYLTAGSQITEEQRNSIMTKLQGSQNFGPLDDELPQIQEAIKAYEDIDLLRVVNAYDNMSDAQRLSTVNSFRLYSQVITGDRSTASHVSEETAVDREVRESIYPVRPLEIRLDYEYTDENGVSVPKSDKVDYRHSRLADRHPHGVLQHTIQIPSLAQSLDSVRLVVAGNVVDGLVDPEERSWIVADKLNKLAKKRDRKKPEGKSSKSPLVRFNYDINSDRYVFRYSWNNIQTGAHKSTAPITTTLLARRVVPNVHSDSGQWEVIHVGRSLKDRVLVSKEFVSIQDRVESYTIEKQKLFERNLLNSTQYTRLNDKLEFKLLVTVGFDTSYVMIDSLKLDEAQNSHKITASITPPKKLKRNKEYTDDLPNLEDRFVKMFGR